MTLKRIFENNLDATSRKNLTYKNIVFSMM